MDINENSIRERAHWLWKQAGEPEGRDLDFWFEAENSFRAESNDGNFSTHTDETYNADLTAIAPTPWGVQS